MFKVTLKIKPNNEWVDGPVLLLKADEMDEFSQTHQYFRVEDATEEDIKLHGTRVPAAFVGFLK